MKAINTFSVHFNLRTEKGKEGKAPVYAAIKVNGEKAMLALKHSVATRCWDVRKGMCKTTTVEGRKLNIYLEEVRQVLGEKSRFLYLYICRIIMELVKLFVGGFPLEIDEMELAKLFAPHGDVSTIEIMHD